MMMIFLQIYNNLRLASKMALLVEGMEEKLTIVALCLGSSPGTCIMMMMIIEVMMMMMMMSQSRSSSSSSPDREKRNPEEAAANICKIAGQVEQEVG